MNELYLHQIETENKQLREQLQLCRNAINDIKEELSNKIEAQDKIINEQALEIAELNESITWWQNRFHAVERDNRELQQKIDKAIEYINNCPEYLWSNVNTKTLLEILEMNNNE